MALLRSSSFRWINSARLLTARVAPRFYQSPSSAHTPETKEGAIEDDPSKNWSIDPLTGRSRRAGNWDYNLELLTLAQRLGHSLNELPSLRAALRVRGLLGSVPAAERGPLEVSTLSVFGRSTLMYFVTEYLYFAYPNLEGSMLTDLSEFLTNNTALNELADYIGITALIRTRKPLTEPKKVSNIFCAVIGALCRDVGGKAARKFIHDFVISQLAGKDLHEVIKLQHPRFMLHAILKGQQLPRPESRLIKETGRATHFPSFVVGVYSGETLLGEGCGTSLKRAEREAMMAALRTRFQKELSEFPLPSDHEEFEREESFTVAVTTSLTKEHNT